MGLPKDIECPICGELLFVQIAPVAIGEPVSSTLKCFEFEIDPPNLNHDKVTCIHCKQAMHRSCIEVCILNN